MSAVWLYLFVIAVNILSGEASQVGPPFANMFCTLENMHLKTVSVYDLLN